MLAQIIKHSIYNHLQDKSSMDLPNNNFKTILFKIAIKSSDDT